MNWFLLILFGIVAISLIIFLVVRNQKDKKEFEEQVNNDYPRSKDQEGDEDAETPMK